MFMIMRMMIIMIISMMSIVVNLSLKMSKKSLLVTGIFACFHAIFEQGCRSLFSPYTSFGIPRVMGAIISLGCNWWSNMHQIDTKPEVHRITYPCWIFLDLSRVILRHNSFLEGIFMTGALNVNN